MSTKLKFSPWPSGLAGALLLGGHVMGAHAQTTWSSNPAAPTAQQAASPPGNVYSTHFAPCTDCGRVTAVTVAEKAGESNAVGLIAGGVAGAVVGHQIGGGFGKDLATIAGAVGGAFAGKKIQENMNTSKVWTVSVKYPNGNTASYDFAQDPGLVVGDSVKGSGNSIVRN